MKFALQLKLRAASQRLALTNKPENRYLTRMDLLDLKSLPRVLGQKMRSFEEQQLPARRVHHGQSARRP